MATIEITEKLVGMWFLALTDESDWLCGLTEIEPEKKYLITYRFRYYKDGKSFDSDDDKNCYRVEVTATRAYALAAIRTIGNGLKQSGAIGEVDETLMHEGDVDLFIKEIQDKPFITVRVEGRMKP